MIYYIADMHFGHTNVLRFDNRPFSDTAQMDDTLLQNWNERVTADDTVYVLGDAFWKNEENSIQMHVTSCFIKAEIARKWSFNEEQSYGEDTVYINKIINSE